VPYGNGWLEDYVEQLPDNDLIEQIIRMVAKAKEEPADLNELKESKGDDKL